MPEYGHEYQPEAEERKPVARKKKPGAHRAISGDALSALKRWYIQIIYGCVLVFAFIATHFWYQRLQRDIISERLELNRQRSRAVVFASMRMNDSRHSYITEQVKERGLGLEESAYPPKKLTDHAGIRSERPGDYMMWGWPRRPVSQ